MKLTENERLLLLIAGTVILAPAVLEFAAKQAATAVSGAVKGSVEGAGNVVGVPATSQSQCITDIQSGSTWDASFSCPAPVWAYSLTHSVNESVNYANEYDKWMEQ